MIAVHPRGREPRLSSRRLPNRAKTNTPYPWPGKIGPQSGADGRAACHDSRTTGRHRNDPDTRSRGRTPVRLPGHAARSRVRPRHGAGRGARAASFLAATRWTPPPTSSRGWCCSWSRSSPSSSSGSCTCCRRRSRTSATTRSATASRRCASCRSCSAACSGRSPGCGPTHARWRTALAYGTEKHEDYFVEMQREARRRAADARRARARHLREELDAMAASGTLPPRSRGAAGELARLKAALAAPSAPRRPGGSRVDGTDPLSASTRPSSGSSSSR